MTEVLAADDHIITQGRSRLRKLRELCEYKKLKAQKKAIPFASQVWHLYLEQLLPCMDWKPRKGDSCFSSIRFMEIMTGMATEMKKDWDGIKDEEIRVDKKTRKGILHLVKAVDEILAVHSSTVQELQRIHSHIEILSRILNDHDASAGEGIIRMRGFCLDREVYYSLPQCGPLEHAFLGEMKDYFLTKGWQLFNYRTIPDAPATNNFEESRYHLLKHYLRRTIGQHSAKEYLVRHGARLFFVNLDAKIEEIETILKHMDQTEARKILDKERPSRNDVESLMHKEHAWIVLNPQFEKLHEILKEQTKKYGKVIMSPREYLEQEAKNGKDISEYFLL
jgi:hypothetical protein